MRPLNNFKIILYNKTRIIPIVVILALQLAVVVFMLSIGVSLLDELKFNLTNTYKMIISVLPDKKISLNERDKIKNELRSIDGIKHVIDGNFEQARSKMIFFGCETRTLSVQKKDMDCIIEALHLKNFSGNLPKSSNEIMLSTTNLNGFKSDIGQKIGRYASGNSFGLRQDYTVSGTFDSESNIYLTNEDNVKKLLYILLIINPDKYDSVDSVLKSEYKNFKIESYEDYKVFGDNAKAMLALLGFIAITVFSFGIWVSVMNLMKNSIIARKNEFSFLRSIGYNEKYVLKRVFTELSAIMIIGCTAGIILGLIALIAFNNLYCIPEGILYTLWDSMYFSIPAVITLVIFITGYFSVSRYIKHLEWVSAMEEAA
jgi:ABC-type antimicrobial peptide transport system permease subunit